MGIAEKESQRRNRGIISSFVNSQQVVCNEKNNVTERQNSNLIIKKTVKETRSTRIQLLIKPSKHKKLLRKCNELDISVNECLNQLLDLFLDK